jgi:sterol desaturase/sphingolipid hydroxylase (fatty acid hydroxylase superfamily)
MQKYIDNIISGWLDFAYWGIAFFIVFGVLAKICPCNENQPLIRKGMLTDILYALIIPIFGNLVNLLFFGIGFALLFHNATAEQLSDYLQNGYGYLGSLPIWLQAALVFVLSDIILYWTHRVYHGKKLWKFHSIHHSPTEIDWLTANRFHPINSWTTFTLINVLMVLAGFSIQSIAVMGVFNTIYSAMVHANLNWTFGKFKYLFASPVFHRWHHTTQKEGLDKNFAPTFPLLDVMFGTFYMPEGKLPEVYGVKGANIPEDFFGQIIYPFK